MELPKNITQIGEADRRCRVYVEDYVISYLRQLNRLAENHHMGIALYGIRKEEGEVAYLFFYGACRLDSLQREVRHLSQAQNQEIEKLRGRFFPDYQFLGYRLLNGEMVEGFHICEQGICRYIAGYACFYEKNDSMLAYMLDSRETEAEPEQVDQEKYEKVRKRQEDRRQEYRSQTWQGGRNKDDGGKVPLEEEPSGRQEAKETGSVRQTVSRREPGQSLAERRRVWFPARNDGPGKDGKKVSSSTMHLMRVSVVGMFALLCLVGISGLQEKGGIEELQRTVTDLLAELTEQKLPDEGEVAEVMNPGQSQTLYTEEELAAAIREENKGGGGNPNSEDLNDGAAMEQTISPEPGTGQEETESGQGISGTESGQDMAGTESTQESPGTEPTQESSGMNPDQETGQSSEEASQPQPESPQPDPGSAEEKSAEKESVEAVAPVSYTIKKGDTLTKISLKHYGTNTKVKEICDFNHIVDPDDIYFGQKILLP